MASATLSDYQRLSELGAVVEQLEQLLETAYEATLAASVLGERLMTRRRHDNEEPFARRIHAVAREISLLEHRDVRTCMLAASELGAELEGALSGLARKLELVNGGRDG